MACRLVGANPLSEPMLECLKFDHQEQTSLSINQNPYIFIQENALENVVCEIAAIFSRPQCVNTLRLRRNRHHFADDISKCIFLQENVWISIKILQKFVPKGPINNIPALVKIMAWHWPGHKPFSEPVVVGSLMHTCISRPQWVKCICIYICISFGLNELTC